MGIPPIQNPGIFGGQPTCPEGYYYDPGSQMCQPIPGTPASQSIQVTAWGLSSNEVDPVQAAKNAGVGFAQSGFIGQFVASLWHALWLVIDDSVGVYFNIYDRIVAFIADQVSNAVTRNNPGLWIAIGSLLSDLLGINLDGATLYNQLATRGTLPAMQAVGGSLIDLLIGEFTGTASGTGGNVTYTGAINSSTGLPAGALSPLQGLNGAKALMGFVLTSAVRQANIDGLVDAIPFGMGAVFEKYSEGVRTNLGIGRMMRFALKPIFQDLIATPLKWAINAQYTPSILSPADAYAAFDQQVFSQQQLQTELSYHGYSPDRYSVLQWKGRSLPGRDELRTLHVLGLLNDNDYFIWMRRTGYTDDITGMLDQYEDGKVARAAVLREAATIAGKYLAGSIPSTQFQGLINALPNNVNGLPLMTPGEVAAYLALPIIAVGSAKHANIPLSQLTTMYETGIITLQEYQAALQAKGYSSDQQAELTLLLLLKAKLVAEQNAEKAAKGTPTL